jgi:hypothetical protein
MYEKFMKKGFKKMDSKDLYKGIENILKLNKFKNNQILLENEKLTQLVVKSIIDIHEKTKIKITIDSLLNYISQNNKDMDIEFLNSKIKIIIIQLKKIFQIKYNLNESSELEDLFFELKKIFPIIIDKLKLH